MPLRSRFARRAVCGAAGCVLAAAGFLLSAGALPDPAPGALGPTLPTTVSTPSLPLTTTAPTTASLPLTTTVPTTVPLPTTVPATVPVSAPGATHPGVTVPQPATSVHAATTGAAKPRVAAKPAGTAAPEVAGPAARATRRPQARTAPRTATAPAARTSTARGGPAPRPAPPAAGTPGGVASGGAAPPYARSPRGVSEAPRAPPRRVGAARPPASSRAPAVHRIVPRGREVVLVLTLRTPARLRITAIGPLPACRVQTPALHRRAHEGRNAIPFAGRLAGRPLPPGTYVLRVVVAGRAGAPLDVPVRVLRRGRPARIVVRPARRGLRCGTRATPAAAPFHAFAGGLAGPGAATIVGLAERPGPGGSTQPPARPAAPAPPSVPRLPPLTGGAPGRSLAAAVAAVALVATLAAMFLSLVVYGVRRIRSGG